MNVLGDGKRSRIVLGLSRLHNTFCDIDDDKVEFVVCVVRLGLCVDSEHPSSCRDVRVNVYVCLEQAISRDCRRRLSQATSTLSITGHSEGFQGRNTTHEVHRTMTRPDTMRTRCRQRCCNTPERARSRRGRTSSRSSWGTCRRKCWESKEMGLWLWPCACCSCSSAARTYMRWAFRPPPRRSLRSQDKKSSKTSTPQGQPKF